MIAIPNMEKPKRCELCPCSYYSEGALSDICQITNEPIDGTPTDCPLIKIVECKDCKHSKEWYGDRSLCYLWSEVGVSVFESGYCNYGERRADETNIKR